MFSLKKHICSIISILLVLMLTTLCAISACAMDTAQGQQYSTNSNGETYGDNLQARQLGYEADLIAAIGENGVEGYVRNAELYADCVSNPMEAVNSLPEVRYIPLYMEDGTTVIGQFKIGSDAAEDSPESRATYAYSNIGVIEYDDYIGNTRNGIKSESGGVLGLTSAWGGTEEGAGFYGITVNIYEQDTNKLVASTGVQYNKEAKLIYSQTLFYSCSDKTAEFYCQGTVKIWRGSLGIYHTHGTFRTPIQQPS